MICLIKLLSRIPNQYSYNAPVFCTNCFQAGGLLKKIIFQFEKKINSLLKLKTRLFDDFPAYLMLFSPLVTE